MQIDLSQEQTKAWDYLDQPERETKRVIYGGQAGGGKSFLICLWQIDRRMRYPGTRGYIAREVLKDLKDSVLITFFDVARDLKIKYRYNDNSSKIIFPNGSEIKLLEVKFRPSDPNFNDLGSTEYTDGAIEEGVSIHKRASEMLLARTRYKHDVYNLYPKQLITCNPGDGWIKDEIVLPYHNTGVQKRKNKFVEATLASNPNKGFVKGYMETLEDMEDPYDKARLLHGDWNAVPQTGGESYKDFDVTKHVFEADKIPYDKNEPLYLTFDENVHPFLTLNIHQMPTKKQLVQIDEICFEHPRNTLTETCREFTRRYRHHEGGVFIDGDATSKKEDVKLEKGYNFFKLVRRELEHFKPTIKVPASNPNVIPRINFINAVFRSNFDGLEFLISDVCKKTIADYQNLKEDSDGKKKKQKVKNPATGVTYEKWGHNTDANDYLYCRIFKDSFNLYVKGPDDNKRRVVTRTTNNRY